MDIDPEVQNQNGNGTPASPPPQTKMPGAFETPKANGAANANSTNSNGDAPVPPPHKSNPTSPAAPAPPTPEDAEAFKANGNKFYKAKDYKKAIEEYTKGEIYDFCLQLLRKLK